MSAVKPNIIIVLGMHRSGTSAIARSLTVLGVDLGDDLFPPSDDNPRGFWEDNRCLEINEKLLRHLGSAYDWFLLRDDLARLVDSDDRIQPLFEQAVGLLRERSLRYGLWGFKDPRTARLLPFWQRAVERADCNAGYVIAVRNPLSVAESLAARNGIPHAKSHLLWLQHVVPALCETAEAPRVVVDYDRLLEDPGWELGRIAGALGLDDPAQHPAEFKDFVDGFLAGELRHTLFETDDIVRVPHIPGDVARFYRLASSMARDAGPTDALELSDTLAAFQQRLSADNPVFAYISSLEGQNTELQRVAGDRQARIEALTEELDSRPGDFFVRDVPVPYPDRKRLPAPEIEEVLVRLGELQARCASAESARNKAEQTAARVVEEVVQLRVWSEEIAEQRAKLESSLAAVQRQWRQETARRTALDTRLEMLEASCERERTYNGELMKHISDLSAELRRQREWQSERDFASEHQITTLREELNATNCDRDELREAYHAQCENLRQLQNKAEADGDRLRAEVLNSEQLLRELGQADEHIAELLRSLSWRLTSPLRFLRRNLVTRPRVYAMHEASRAVRRFWWWLPMDVAARLSLKGKIFRALPTFLGRTEAYRNWRRLNGGGIVVSIPSMEGGPVETGEYVPKRNRLPPAHKPARLICFYLPQFHPIPENDAWWGEGFTEWTNVKPARPQFAGHYQPHEPGDLGYYDLLDVETQRRQVELAKQYGIEGFCFYFYWFAGKLLLETPIQNYLADASLDLPFCLCWANENWSRRWDGLDDALLIAQDHSAEDDLAFIEHVAQYMRDPRYIRIDGKPLLLVYRPGLLPEPAETAQRWREWCRANGLGEIYLAYTQSFEVVDPAAYGFDAALEFPPNNSGPPDVTDTVEPVADDFACIIYDWQIFVERSRKYRSPGYKLFRGVCPAWDNTPRRKNESTVFLNSNPADYQLWLENAVEYTAREFPNPDERLIFVNAWNEWAEGAHLEPDRRYGYAWLEATRKALDKTTGRDGDRKIVVVSHDAHPHGAQYLALNLTRMLVQDFGFAVDVVLLGDGELAGEFKRWAQVHSLAGDHDGERSRLLARRLAASGHSAAIVNTTVSGLFLGALAEAGLRCVALIHELPGIIADYGLEEHAVTIAQVADRVVFAATCVEEAFSRVTGCRADTFTVRPQGLYKRNRYRGDVDRARRELRESLGLGESTRIVLGVGFADHRKGVDLFVETGLEVMRSESNVHFIWLGHWEQNMQALVEQLLQGEDDAGRFHFPGRTDDTDLYYAGADLFALTSREDPFPSVVMESLEVAVPVVAFRGSGGSEELIGDGAGVLVPLEDCIAMAQAVLSLLADDETRRVMGAYGAQRIDMDFSFRHYLFDLLDYAGVGLKRVSAVVPNYNYAHYLRQRLDSVFAQTYPLFEVVIMDDASTDSSVAVIEQYLANAPVDYRLNHSDENSGSVFRQWRRGVAMARGDYVWICEADDYAEPDFVAEVSRLMDDGVIMGYSQSAQVDEAGNILVGDYLDYTADVHADKWLADYICEGAEELAYSLSVKNTIPNVSAVLFKRDELQSSLEAVRFELSKLRIAGDWLVYAELLRHGRIAYVARALNYHRRHSNSVTLGSDNERHMAEILYMQDRVRASVGADTNVVALAWAYALSVYQHLGLDQTYAHAPADQPGVARCLAVMRGEELPRPHAVAG